LFTTDIIEPLIFAVVQFVLSVFFLIF